MPRKVYHPHELHEDYRLTPEQFARYEALLTQHGLTVTPKTRTVEQRLKNVLGRPEASREVTIAGTLSIGATQFEYELSTRDESHKFRLIIPPQLLRDAASDKTVTACDAAFQKRPDPEIPPTPLSKVVVQVLGCGTAFLLFVSMVGATCFFAAYGVWKWWTT